MANPYQVQVGPLTLASATNIAQSQSPAAAAITLDGSLVASGVATLDAARRVVITSGGNDTGITFTVIGTNRGGNSQSETVTGASGAAATTTQDFKTVSSVTHTGSVATTVTVGTSAVASTQWCVLDYQGSNPVNVGIAVQVSGTINYTVEYTYDNPNSPYTSTWPTVFSISALAAKTAVLDGSLTAPAYAVRLTANTNTNPAYARMIAIQSGLGGQ